MQFMKYKFIYFAISLIVLFPGIYSLISYGLRPSIDFTGGSLLEIQTAKPVSLDVFSAPDLAYAQTSSDNVYLLRFKPLTQDQSVQYVESLKAKIGEVSLKRFETVGPTVGAELTRKALLSVAIASICIVLYIAWSFRKIPHPYSSWKFGISAVIALLHDALVLIGLFSIFGHFYKVEIDSLFITALLTVIGFSVHDTIVVFDRIRENLPKFPKVPFGQIVDFSLTETLNRSLNTSLTVILTLVSLLLFGGETTRWFIVALLIGIISGTFSSLFNAAPILALWEERK